MFVYLKPLNITILSEKRMSRNKEELPTVKEEEDTQNTKNTPVAKPHKSEHESRERNHNETVDKLEAEI